MTDTHGNSRRLALSASILWIGLICGCGGEQGDGDVAVVESPQPDFSPSPGESVITARPSPSPRGNPHGSTGGNPAAVNTAPDGTVLFLLAEPNLFNGVVEFQPRVQVELSGGAGSPVHITDLTGAEPGGVNGRFKSVKPGHYMLKVSSTVLPEFPLVNRAVEIKGQDAEVVNFGAVIFQLPKEREQDLAKAIELTLVELPSRRQVFRGLLSTIDTLSLVGESHPYTMLLPFGNYTYQLQDRSADESLGFVGVPKGMAPEMENTKLQIQPEKPVDLVNLTSILRTIVEKKKEQ